MSNKNSVNGKMNNVLASMMMVVIGLAGVFALSRSVFYENHYLLQLGDVQNCGLVNRNSTVSAVQSCITDGLNNADGNRVQAQIFEVAGTAMITAAVVSSITVLQRRR
jgi:hypothetical protein